MDEPSLMQALALHLWCKQLLPFLVLSRSLSFSLVLTLSLGFEPYYNHRRVQSHRLASVERWSRFWPSLVSKRYFSLHWPRVFANLYPNNPIVIRFRKCESNVDFTALSFWRSDLWVFNPIQGKDEFLIFPQKSRNVSGNWIRFIKVRDRVVIALYSWKKNPNVV